MHIHTNFAAGQLTNLEAAVSAQKAEALRQSAEVRKKLAKLARDGEELFRGISDDPASEDTYGQSTSADNTTDTAHLAQRSKAQSAREPDEPGETTHLASYWA